jgi:hypothetical protein
MNLALVGREAEATTSALESRLLELARYGAPTLGVVEGWHCSVKMNTNTTGTNFTVRSAFDCKTPIAAADQCMERVQQALAAIAKPQGAK